MKTAQLVLFLFLGLVSSTFANDEEDALKVAQKFYDSYIQVLVAGGDGDKVVLKSPLLTDSLKKAYAKFIKGERDHDPIISAQDYPDKGFKAAKIDLEGDEAVVTMQSRDKAYDQNIDVTLVKNDETWQIQAIGDFPSE